MKYKLKGYKWKEYSVSIPIRPGVVATTISELIKEEQECLRHSLDYAIMSGSGRYRPYRRGKNRCLRCGCKI